MKLGLPIMQNKLYHLTNENKDDAAERVLDYFGLNNRENACPLDIDYLAQEGLYLTFKYLHLSVDNSILGLIAFSDGEINCFERLYEPKTVHINEGDVVLEECLTGTADRRRVRFTKAHEVAHWLLHRMYHTQSSKEYEFRAKPNYFICRESRKSSNTDRRTFNYSLDDLMEWQADALGAALLMPKNIFKEVSERELRRNGIRENCLIKGENISKERNIITAMSDAFDVSRAAAGIRLQQLQVFRTKNEYYN